MGYHKTGSRSQSRALVGTHDTTLNQSVEQLNAKGATNSMISSLIWKRSSMRLLGSLRGTSAGCMVGHRMNGRVRTSLVLPTCKRCGKRDILRPAAFGIKRNTNWLFLLLGQMLGCYKLRYLRYFCKNHRKGIKHRLLYLTYLGL